MEELKRTKRITIATFSFVIVLLIAFLSIKKPIHQYQMSAEDMAYELMLIYQVTPDEAMEIMYDSTVVFVDVRNYYEYQADHLENAYNIPVANLLDEKSKEYFDKWKSDSLQVILYGKDELQVNAPWMLLYQLGYTNTRLLMGGMTYIDKLYSDELAENEGFNVETPMYDYAGIIAAASSGENTIVTIQPKKKVVVRKKEKKAAEGGC
jgi:rhodanese-related sulfurtransferase